MKLKFIHKLFVFLLIFISREAFSFNSVKEFELRSTTDGGFSYIGNLHNCFTNPRKVLFQTELSDLNNTYIPPILGKKTRGRIPESSVGTWAFVSSTAREATYLALLTKFPIGTVIAFFALSAEYLVMLDVCTNAYVVQPHEYINRNVYGDSNHWPSSSECNEAGFNRGVTQDDVPFYFSCDPNYDPVTGSSVTSSTFSNNGGLDTYGVSDAQEVVGRVWGYMGAASPYCVKNTASGSKLAQKEKVGQIAYNYLSGWDRFWNGYTKCEKRTPKWLKAGQIEWDGAIQFYAHYKMEADGKIKMCVVAPYTLMPIHVGCSTVAAPAEESALDPFLKEYVEGTRCSYLITGRTDLNKLGEALAKSATQSDYPVTAFLRSDFHVTSTVIGCVKDMLQKVMMRNNDNNSLFITLQNRLQDIVFAALTLYLCIVGIKIMSSPQGPKRSELIMFAIKFALVLGFTRPDFWYQDNGNNPADAEGLYPTLLWASEEIANFFMGAQNANDIMGLCKYNLQGSELLSERNIIPPSGAVATDGSEFIKMSMWDLVDCKVVNYLNFGSCDYSLLGIIGAWLIGAALFLSGIGILLMIVCFLYVYLLLLVVFRFAHIFILSAFIITVLVLLSPIFICFSLFEQTKGMFDQWMKNLLGYVLYPALLFAFIALMLATLDSIYYGDLTKYVTNGKLSNGQSVAQACQNVNNSLYCETVKALGDNPCKFKLGEVIKKFTKTEDLNGLGVATVIQGNLGETYWLAILKMMLFALLFYLFMDSITGFMAALVGIEDLGSHAKGGINAFVGAKMAMMPYKKAGEAALKGLGKAGSAAMNKIKRSGGGGGGGSGGGSS